MKEKVIITTADKIAIPTGFTAPVWLGTLNDFVALLVGLATLFYFIFKGLDAYYQWKHDWHDRIEDNKKRKSKKR